VQLGSLAVAEVPDSLVNKEKLDRPVERDPVVQLELLVQLVILVPLE